MKQKPHGHRGWRREAKKSIDGYVRQAILCSAASMESGELTNMSTSARSVELLRGAVLGAAGSACGFAVKCA